MPSHENSAEVVLALDVGGTYIKSALFCTGRMIRRLPLVPSRSDSGKAEIAAAIQAAIAQAGTFSRLAVSVPGPFDYQDGIFRMTHKFAAVNGCSFQELSGGVSGTFLHDADAFLLGELIHGAARGFQICGGVTLGTGLGIWRMDRMVLRQSRSNYGIVRFATGSGKIMFLPARC